MTSKITQKIPQQNTWKSHHVNYRKQPFWHCTHTSESTNMKYKTLIMGNSITYTINCK
jgi:hypothetical protein